MLFSFHADGYTLRDQDKALITEKIDKLKKFNRVLNDASTQAHVEVVRGTRHESPNFGLRVQITIPNGSLRAQSSGKVIPDALDKVEQKLRNQIEKLKIKKDLHSKIVKAE